MSLPGFKYTHFEITHKGVLCISGTDPGLASRPSSGALSSTTCWQARLSGPTRTGGFSSSRPFRRPILDGPSGTVCAGACGPCGERGGGEV